MRLLVLDQSTVIIKHTKSANLKLVSVFFHLFVGGHHLENIKDTTLEIYANRTASPQDLGRLTAQLLSLNA